MFVTLSQWKDTWSPCDFDRVLGLHDWVLTPQTEGADLSQADGFLSRGHARAN